MKFVHSGSSAQLSNGAAGEVDAHRQRHDDDVHVPAGGLAEPKYAGLPVAVRPLLVSRLRRPRRVGLVNYNETTAPTRWL
jgi:hypothetical protein